MKEVIPITELDALVSPNEFNIIKASLPLMSEKNRGIISTVIKFKELSNTINLTLHNQVSICSDTKINSLNDYIDSIRAYLNDSQINLLENLTMTLTALETINDIK